MISFSLALSTLVSLSMLSVGAFAAEPGPLANQPLITGDEIKITAQNTACGSDHFAKLSYEISGGFWNEQAKSIMKTSSENLSSIDYAPQTITIRSLCQPIRCIVDFTSGLRNNYSVFVERLNENGEVIRVADRENIAKSDAKARAQSLLQQKVCAKVETFGYWSKVQL